ncbi:uncharacterized protein LOC111306234 [Durio zibethinus]|uniref:Uncharacterized protein LOC111306234 n=1 Tax=Durio zibethinus TaxID=66656 RepID=A0A6P6A550_DURZI|nr:uncharacterized protein LOC111306234 [Durio zibethinus]
MESMVIDRTMTKWKNLKQRLGLKAMGCCGATWTPRARISTISILLEDEDEEAAERQQVIMSRSGNVVNNRIQNRRENSASTPLLVGQQPVVVTPGNSGMNLAMALAAERNMRGNNVVPSPTQVKTLMRLIEETEGVDWNNYKKKRKDNVVVHVEGGGGSCDWMCCVCMERKKGAAFIPCGHTFCRVCSREVWLDRGSCPVCNRSILDILDIF